MNFEIVEKDGRSILVKVTLSEGESTDKLIDIIVPDGVAEIAKCVFRGLWFIRSVKLPDSIRIIRTEAFRECKALESINIPDSVIQIGGQAFDGTPWLSAQKDEFCILGDGILAAYNGGSDRVTIPDGVKKIMPGVFVDSNISEVQFPDSLEVIGAHAFKNCGGLEEITFPERLREINRSAFSGCGLKRVWLPDSVRSVGREAFSNCRKLEYVCISEDIETMESAPFSNCEELMQIRVRAGERTEPFEWCYMWSGVSKNVVLNIESEQLPHGAIAREMNIILYAPNYKFQDDLSVAEWMYFIFSIIRARAMGFEYPPKTIAGAVNVLKENDYFRRIIIGLTKHFELLDFLMEFRLLTISECDELIRGQGEDDPELSQKLIEYRSGFTEAEIEEYNESFFRDPTVAEAKKSWRFSYNEDGTITLNEYIGYDRNIEVPISISGAAVTVIGSGTFVKMINLDEYSSEKVVFNIPYGIERIETKAFPNSESMRGKRFFLDFRYKLHQNENILYLPDSITEIEDGAFEDCVCCVNVQLPSKLERIPSNMFANSVLERVEYPDQVREIGAYAFLRTWIKDANIPYGTVEIGEGAYSDCMRLANVTIPDTVKKIGKKAFRSSRISSVILPKSLEELGEEAFGLCTDLSGITLCEGITHIPAECFGACSIRNINIPESVLSISNGAFRGCRKLEKLELPQGLIELGDSAFLGCGELGDIVIPHGVKCIGDSCFYSSGVTSVTFGKSLKVVGNSAFGRTSIESITLPKGIKYGSYAFAECSDLKEVVIEDGVEYLGENCFRRCVSLTEISIPGSVINIEKNIFSDCSNLAEVKILDGVAAIGSKAFSNCNALKKVIIPASVVSISVDAFHNSYDVVIFAPNGSYAIEYAKRNGICFRRMSAKKEPERRSNELSDS